MNQSILDLLKSRYFLTNENKWQNIAKRVSSIYPKSYGLINAMKLIPSTPTLLNANTGGERLGTLSSCFPMNLEDSIDGIYEALKDGAKVTKMGGGVGYVFSLLRGSSEKVKSINRQSSGSTPIH